MKQITYKLGGILVALLLVLMLFPQTVYASFQVFVQGGNIDLTVYTPDGKLSLDVSPGDSIESVREKIKDQTGILPSVQRLTYNGAELLDGTTIGDNNIQKEAIIQLDIILDSSFVQDPDTYYQRHYDFWLSVHTQLLALTNSGTTVVNTAGHNLDMVMHFTFDALTNTNRTLVIKHQGSTYTIRGKAESADHVWMGGILLGNNHSFSILGAYRK